MALITYAERGEFCQTVDETPAGTMVSKGDYAVWHDDGKTLLFVITDYRLGDGVGDVRKLRVLRELLEGI